jgi:hypothetical protein
MILQRVFLTFFVLSLVNDGSFLQNEVESGNVFGLQEKKSKKKKLLNWAWINIISYLIVSLSARIFRAHPFNFLFYSSAI